jgi:hypothetical protein
MGTIGVVDALGAFGLSSFEAFGGHAALKIIQTCLEHLQLYLLCMYTHLPLTYLLVFAWPHMRARAALAASAPAMLVADCSSYVVQHTVLPQLCMLTAVLHGCLATQAANSIQLSVAFSHPKDATQRPLLLQIHRSSSQPAVPALPASVLALQRVVWVCLQHGSMWV